MKKVSIVLIRTWFYTNLIYSLNITNTLALKNLIQDNTDKPDLIRPSLSKDSKLVKSKMVARKLKPIKSQLANFLNIRRQIAFQKKPNLKFFFEGDVLTPDSLSGCVSLEAEGCSFPIGSFDRFDLEFNLFDKQWENYKTITEL